MGASHSGGDFLARRARITKAAPKNIETARDLLLKRGCEPIQLDFLTESVRSARRGANPLFPTRADDVFTNPDTRYLDSVEERICVLSKDLRSLWTERGTRFIYLGTNERWMLELPNLLDRYWFHLVAIRHVMQTRRPATHDFLKCTLVKYVRDATGGKRWHDAELALLCHEERRAWSKWRAAHYQPPPPPSTERREVIKPIEG
jgi:hypothetical protein